jgi:hypothetical protein
VSSSKTPYFKGTLKEGAWMFLGSNKPILSIQGSIKFKWGSFELHAREF